jgi:pyruvate kinase
LPLQLCLHDGANEFSKQSAICNSIITLAKQLPATAIVAETKSGATALQIAARRPEISLLAVTSDARVANQLAICYGVKSYVRKDGKYAASKLTDWLLKHKVLEKGDIVITASGKYPGVVGTTDTIKVRALE